MRFLLKVSLPVEAANAIFKSGKFAPTMQAILGELRPEAAYFTEMDGERTGIIVVDIQDPSQIPAIGEPFFHAFHARVEFHPAMTAEDLGKAGPAIEAAVTKYG